MSKFHFKDLKKRLITFGLEDTLIPGRVETDFKMDATYEILNELKEIKKKAIENNEKFDYILVSGLCSKKAKEKIEKYKLEKYFDSESIFYVNSKYIESKEETDKKIYKSKISENSDFKDEYYKQVVLQKFIDDKKFDINEIIYVGHDVWTEGFYFSRFSNVNFALIKSSFSHLDEKKGKLVKGLIYTQRKWSEIKKLLFGKFIEPNLNFLKNYSNDVFREKLLDKKTIANIVSAKLKKMNSK